MSPLRLAWLTLLHQRVRTAISLAGVTFAVVLICMQLGMRGAVERTATQLYDCLDFDLLLRATNYLDLGRSGSIPRERLAQARAASGVRSVLPLTVSNAEWRPAAGPQARVRPRWNILVLAVEPANLPEVFRDTGAVFGSARKLSALQSALGRLDTVLLDRGSWPEYGSPAQRRPGSLAELNGRRVEIVGSCNVGTGFGYNGLLITSEATFERATSLPVDRVTFGLVRLTPGADLQKVQAALQRQLPPDVRVVSREEAEEYETNYWLTTTAVGQFVTLGVGIALVVGAVFVYQIMSGDIRNHIPEYATVKAMGYRSSFLARVVLAQALLLGLVGYVPGLLASFGLDALLRQVARIPIGMTFTRAGIVLALALGMCLGAGALAVRKVNSADPANLF
jgi:putative ABC transport system permease protein